MKRSRVSISTQFVLLVLIILAMNGAAYFLILKNVYAQELRAQAQTVVANVEAFGAWVAQHGRVWVKDNSGDSYLGEMTVVNPAKPDEPIHFYSKNPALAQREFSEAVAKSSSPAKFRMTSHNVMNPVNKPDAFESTALDIIRNNNQTEHSAFVKGEYRYAQAVYHKAACISCHGDPAKAPADVINRYGKDNGFGFKEGEVAGVISVSIPTQSLSANLMNFVGPLELGLVLMSLVLALWFIRTNLIKPIKRLTQSAQEISTGHDAPINTDGIELNTRNEVDQLVLALSRMRNSTYLAIKKMREARAEASDTLVKAKAAVAKAKSDHSGKAESPAGSISQSRNPTAPHNPTNKPKPK